MKIEEVEIADGYTKVKGTISIHKQYQERKAVSYTLILHPFQCELYVSQWPFNVT